MNKLMLVFVFILCIIVPINIQALVANVTGVTLTIAYDEPAVNVDDSPVTDLDHTSVYYDMGSGSVKAKDVPASALTGNGHIVTTLDVPVTQNMEKMVSVWATASDTSANESDKSNIVQVRVDRLPPKPPK